MCGCRLLKKGQICYKELYTTIKLFSYSLYCFRYNSYKRSFKNIAFDEYSNSLLQNGDSDHVLRIFDDEAQAMESARNSSKVLDEAYDTAVAILSKYAEQKDRLKVNYQYHLIFI